MNHTQRQAVKHSLRQLEAFRSKLRAAKRLWGMFFALDNAAEYGHWVVDDKAPWLRERNLGKLCD